MLGVTVEDVRAELIKLGHGDDDISDRTIAQYLLRQRRVRRNVGSLKDKDKDCKSLKNENNVDVDDDWVSKDPGRARGNGVPRRPSRSSPMRPPWDGDAFQVVPPERAATSSRRISKLPRRKGGVTKDAAVEGRASSGRIDVVAVNEMYRKQWALSPAVVRGEEQTLVGFAQNFRAQHAREERKRELFLQSRRRYRT
jgi:hypothetical protein